MMPWLIPLPIVLRHATYGLCALLFLSAGRPAAADAADDYKAIVAQAASGDLSSATIFHVDIRIATRTALTPAALMQIGCHGELRTDSAEWPTLIKILETGEPVATEEPGGVDVRWGVVFRGANNLRREIFFGAYYGPSSDSRMTRGYVDGHAIHLKPELPKQMLALIRQMDMVDPILPWGGCPDDVDNFYGEPATPPPAPPPP